jgi:hypothetical protein
MEWTPRSRNDLVAVRDDVDFVRILNVELRWVRPGNMGDTLYRLVPAKNSVHVETIAFAM